MEGELEIITKVWFLAIISLSYCFYFSSKLPKGIFRLISLTPVFILFLYLPLTVSSAHIIVVTAFFLAWLGNFKLLLFAFDQPPLSPPPPSLFLFISLASLPIKPKTTTPSQSKSKPPHRSNSISHHLPKSILVAIKVVILALLHHSFNYKQYLHENVVLAMYCVNMYIEIELILALAALPARAIYGFDLEPQFNEPYLATSLQDFWGRRWNLMVTSILRPTIYYPIRRISARVLGPMWVSSPAVVASFLVSGLMHELLYYYTARVAPTWEVTWFFMLHGVAVAVEVAVKKVVPEKMRLHRAVSGPLALGFSVATARWLFFPQLVRNGVDERFVGDYYKLVNFLKGLLPS
ncbi:hypothetical protein like AT5G55380 [Hibiscus trionum]|uniref:Wax synthase domain-containing protein n=1 Tax=Hibiscus trionum TaxID=183268 RepID=A0A9W7LH01_HIBTR|nr:hypothetical protein like AT5G55380 [Hibiscus trionum]